jgi:hypothetical protein
MGTRCGMSGWLANGMQGVRGSRPSVFPHTAQVRAWSGGPAQPMEFRAVRRLPVASRKLVSQLSAVGAPYATCSSFPVVGSVAVSSAIEASLR